MMAVVGLLLSGCVALPETGGVSSDPDQEPSGQAEGSFDYTPSGPRPGSTPLRIVEDFLLAMQASPQSTAVARKFLTEEARAGWFPEKTTLVYGLFAGILGVGLLQGRSYLAWVMADFLPMLEEGWMKLTRRLTGFFAGLAVANEVVWRTMSTDAWVKIETFGFPLLMFLFLWAQILTLQRYIVEQDGGGD